MSEGGHQDTCDMFEIGATVPVIASSLMDKLAILVSLDQNQLVGDQ